MRRQKFTLEMHERMLRAALRPKRAPGLPSLPRPSPQLTDSLLKRVRPDGKMPVVKEPLV